MYILKEEKQSSLLALFDICIFNLGHTVSSNLFGKFSTHSWK